MKALLSCLSSAAILFVVAMASIGFSSLLLVGFQKENLCISLPIITFIWMAMAWAININVKDRW